MPCVVVATLLAAACGPSVPVDELPALVDVATDEMIPAIAEQIGEARDAVERSPTSASRAGKLGMIHRAYNQREAAEAALRRARMLAPGKARWMYFHAEVLSELGRHEEALEAVGDFLEREPNDLSGLLLAAKSHNALGDLDAASAALDTLLAREPVEEALMLKSAILEQRGDLPGALAAMEECLAVNGPFGKGYYQMSLLHRRLGNAAEADLNLRLSRVHAERRLRPYFGRLADALRLNLSSKPLLGRAAALKAAGDNRGALEVLEQAIDINPERMSTRVALVLGYAAEGEFERAREHLQLGRADEPDSGRLHYAQGRLEMAQGRLASAVVAFERAVARAPEHVESAAWLGHALMLRGEYERAGPALERALAIDPENQFARFYYARFLLSRNDAPAAIAAIERMTAVELPDTPTLLAMLAGLYRIEGRDQEAMAAIEQGMELARLYGNDKAIAKLRDQRARLALPSSNET